MTKWTILGDHVLDQDNLQQSGHDWLDSTIQIFSDKFWADPDVAAQLQNWSVDYKVSPQLLTKYVLILEVEAEGRAACGEPASIADDVWKGITDLTTFTGDSEKSDFFDAIIDVYLQAGHQSVPSRARLDQIWASAGGS